MLFFKTRIEIEQFGEGRRQTFCALDRPFHPGRPRRVHFMPGCRDNKQKDPGATFLGAVLNSDPVGNAEYILNQVILCC